MLPLCTKVHVCVEEALNVELNICPAGGRFTAHVVVGVERVMKDIYIVISWHYKALMKNIEAFML